MKITAKPESQKQTSPDIDGSSIATTPISPDFFYNLIQQTSQEQTSQTGEGDSEISGQNPDNLLQVNQSQSNAAYPQTTVSKPNQQDTAAVTDSSQLIMDQFNAVEKTPIEQVIKPAIEDAAPPPLATVDSQDITLFSNATMKAVEMKNTQPVVVAQSETISDPALAAIMQQTAKPLQPADSKQFNLEMKANEVNVPNFSEDLSVKPITQPINKPVKFQQLDKITKDSSPAINPATLNQKLFDDKNTDIQAVSNSQPSIVVHTPNNEALSSQQQKCIDALVQTGGMINSQTPHQISENNQGILPDLNATKVDYITQTNNKHIIDYDIKVELQPASLKAIGNQIYDAKIQIYPPELGQVIAKLKVNQNSAELVMTAENEHVKKVIESNMAQLRENFQKADINLTQILVQTTSSEAKQQQSYQQQNQESRGELSKNSPIIGNEPSLSSNTTPVRKSDSIVDTYA